MMLAMFVLWLIVFLAAFRRWRLTVPLALVTLLYTLVILKSHMTSELPLSF